MKGLNEEEYGTRTKKREKRRKTNIILNSLIGLVILLIIIVSYNIFFGGNEEKTAGTIEQAADSNEKEAAFGSSEDEQEDGDAAENQGEPDSDAKQASEEDEATEEGSEPVVTEGGSSPDVKTTIENPDWKPIGTSQTGEHPTGVYDESSVDWKEMLQAISYATGIEEGNMTVWFLGNNGVNKSVATVSVKASKQKYRVYIDWVDGEGWKPVKIEELK